MKNVFSDIPDSDTWKIARKINEGWSDDDKYYIKTNGGNQFLLRISDASSLEKEQAYYAALKELNHKNIPVSKLMNEGICNNGKNTFRLFRWIEGAEARKSLGNFSAKKQYDLGVQAGVILREIHQINCPPNQPKWSIYYNRKIESKIERYKNCGIRLKNADKILTCIKKHRHLIDNRPQSFHHGDYHIGNMLITPENTLAIIDFNRLDFGDLWEEFNRIIWSAAKSPAFASGQIHGYFDYEIPSGFFELMALYIAVNQLGGIPWAVPYGKQQVEVLVRQTEEVLEWYDDFKLIIPRWYNQLKIK